MRRYTLRLTIARDATRRLDAGAHRAKLEAAIRRVLPPEWALERGRITSRVVAPPKPETPPDAPEPHDPLARISERLPAYARQWCADVLRTAHCARVRVLVRRMRRHGGMARATSITIVPWESPFGSILPPREYDRVAAWLRKRGAEPDRCNAVGWGWRYLFLHEVAHCVADKRQRAAGSWRRERPHGTRFRRALLGLLRRWVPEAFQVTDVAASAPQEA